MKTVITHMRFWIFALLATALVVAATATKARSLQPVAIALAGDKLAGRGLDLEKWKLKYPVIKNNILAFLVVADPEKRKTSNQAFLYDLIKFHTGNRKWLLPSSAVIGENAKSTGFGRSKKQPIISILDGPTIVKAATDSNEYELTALDSSGNVHSERISRRPFDLTFDGNRILYAGSDGIFQGSEQLFDCFPVWSLSAIEGAGGKTLPLAFGYYDNSNSPRITFVDLSTPPDCLKISQRSVSGLLPSWSPDGKYLASVTSSIDEGDSTWELNVSSANGKAGDFATVAEEKNIKIYDIKTDVFKYNSSYAWAGLSGGRNALYFLKRTTNNIVQRLECSGGRCGKLAPIGFSGTYCAPKVQRTPVSAYIEKRDSWKGQLVWAQVIVCNQDTGTEESRIDFDSLEWVAPHVFDGREFLVGQVTVRVYRKLKDTTPYVTRLVLFEVVD